MLQLPAVWPAAYDPATIMSPARELNLTHDPIDDAWSALPLWRMP